MHHWLALCVGFNAELSTSVAVCLHLFSKESLTLENIIFESLDLGSAKSPIVGQEVDQPHGARFTDVQIRRRGAIATVGELV